IRLEEVPRAGDAFLEELLTIADVHRSVLRQVRHKRGEDLVVAVDVARLDGDEVVGLHALAPYGDGGLELVLHELEEARGGPLHSVLERVGERAQPSAARP